MEKHILNKRQTLPWYYSDFTKDLGVAQYQCLHFCQGKREKNNSLRKKIKRNFVHQKKSVYLTDKIVEIFGPSSRMECIC